MKIFLIIFFKFVRKNNSGNHNSEQFIVNVCKVDLYEMFGLNINFLAAEIFTISLWTLFHFIEGGCNWPSAFASTTWEDNERGTLTFSATEVTGLSIDVSARDSSTGFIDTWECASMADFGSRGILTLKSTQVFTSVGATYVAYLCLVMTQITGADSYYYYQKHAMEGTLNERVKIFTDGSLTTAAEICGSVTVPTEDFHFMVKTGSETASKQYCSPSLLAKFDYEVTDASGAVTCDTSTDNWNVCTDRTAMTFDYSTCPTEMMYSATGTVVCMVNLTSTYEYVVVYNTDASASSKFSCVVSDSAGTAATFVSGRCGQTSQTPTVFAQDSSGTNIGFKVTMTPTETCPFLQPTTATTTTTSATTAGTQPEPEGGSIIPIIIGAVVGLLLLLLAVAIAIYCWKRKKNRVTEHTDEKTGIPPGFTTNEADNGHVARMTVVEIDNPALTATPLERNTLTPLPRSRHPDLQLVVPPISTQLDIRRR
ncbi:mucin-22-like isoform X1 [Mya arenaria]|uniref:mucin-22-like isoform X1 n=1 Tax=Mya arenaria TaxID=6604 RepID=UPI0022E28364|nr:mucin-22-like isoform X1 [Mya arenaria]